MATVTTATGRRIAYDSTGAGPPVLLLNGALAGRGLLAPLVADLAPQFRVLAPDLRDAGESAPEPAAYTVDDLAEDAVALLDALGVPQAHVVGISLGSYVAVQLAARHPGRVRRLVLVATTAPDPARAAAPPAPASWWAWWDDDPLVRLPRLVRALASPALGARLTDAALAAFARLDAGDRLRRDGARRQLEAARSYDRLGRPAAVRAPTLILQGALDAPARAAALAAAIPGARLRRLPAAGHLVLLEDPAAVREALLGFLRAAP